VKKKDGEKAPAKPSKAKAEPPPPPSFADMAVCNAAGALNHLTFLDDAKIQARLRINII
jgi:hypothetical protein